MLGIVQYQDVLEVAPIFHTWEETMIQNSFSFIIEMFKFECM